MLLTGNIVDSTGKPFLTAYYYKSDINGNILSALIPVTTGQFAFYFDENDNDIYWRWGAPGFTDWKNQPYGNGGYLVNNNPFLVTMHTPDVQNTLVPFSLLGLLLLLATKKKKAVGKLETKDVYPYLIIGGVLVATGMINKILQSLGIIDSADTVALDNASKDPGSFWNVNYWRQFSVFNHSLTIEQASEKVTQLQNAFGYFSDDVAAVNAVFHSLQTKAEASYLAYIFLQGSGKDLLTWLRGSTYPNDRLSDNEVNSINAYLSSLPTN